ncbi:MAG: toprim domain-containing protein, partial [Nitrososphaeria archaeon]|nr:toprim domain-containing protein [Nitrososphaeria archaeon]
RRLLDKLAADVSRGTPVIVEGKKDARALKELGVAGDIIYAKTSGKTFLDVLGEVEKREKNEVILLMDFDRRGKRWTRRLAKHLERMKIKPNLVFWRGLSSLVGGDVKDIEGLSTYFRTLETKIGKNILGMG